MIKLFICLLLTNATFAVGNTVENSVELNNTIANQETILSKLDLVTGLDLSEWISELSRIDEQTKNYLLTREKECSGEFASLIINEKGEKKYQKKKLTSAEKKHCSYMLVNFRINFNKKIFNIRKNYLLKVQKIQLDDLKKLETRTLTKLEMLAQKYK